MLIGVLGQAGVGKDTVADRLVNHYGFVKVALADPLKRICKEVYAFSDDQLWGPSQARNGQDLRFPTGKGYLSPRVALQTLGTEWGRTCYQNTWIDYAIRTAKLIMQEGYSYTSKRGTYKSSLLMRWIRPRPTGVVFSDLRFRNEFQLIRSMHKGYVVRVKRPGVDGSVGVANHASEAEQRDFCDADFDYVLNNNGSIPDLYEDIAKMFERSAIDIGTRLILRGGFRK